MKTFVHVVDAPVAPKEPERHFSVNVSQSGRLGVSLANDDGSPIDCSHLFYITPEGVLQICSFVNKDVAKQAGIQLVTGNKIRVVGAE